MRLSVALLAIILLFLPLFAACAGESSILVPAVLGSGGDLVGIQVKIIDGSGDIFITADPHTGTSTQASAEDAVLFAFLKSNRSINHCDVLVKIDGKGIASYVDGPSAGAAMSVVTYAALNGLQPRTDAVVTGGSTAYGEIIPVGGLFEKARAAASAGKSYIVTPLNRISEKIILMPLKEKYNITIVEASDITQALEFMLFNKSIPTNEIRAMIRPLPEVKQYTDTDGLDYFKSLASYMVAMENGTINTLPSATNESMEIKDFFLSETARQSFLIAQGYYFSAANEAFLNYIDAETMRSSESLDLAQKTNEIDSCLSKLRRLDKTDGNFEYLIGSDLREEWAIERVKKVSSENSELVEERYFSFNELMYADAWCKIATNLRQAPSSGAVINESLWKELANRKLVEAGNLEVTAEDEKEHLLSAQSLYDQGQYGAAIYDTTYVLAMHDADAASATISNRTVTLAAETRHSIWGRIYQSHGALLSQSNTDVRSTFRILTFASYLDDVTDEMRNAAQLGSGTGKLSDQMIFDIVGIGIAVAFVLFSVGLYLLIIGRKSTKLSSTAGKSSVTYKKSKYAKKRR